jgi:hypothetical protein
MGNEPKTLQQKFRDVFGKGWWEGRREGRREGALITTILFAVGGVIKCIFTPKDAPKR